MELKKDIRRKILTIRDNLSKDERHIKSKTIINQLINLQAFQTADCIYCYVNYRSEVETKEFIELCFQQKKKVAVPKICDNEMKFYYINCLSDLEDGYRGIPEPKTKALASDYKALVIMPGAAFDKQRNRIGYGKGFYDTYLEKHSSHSTVALAFSCQIVSTIAADMHDIKPDIIITEEHIYDTFTE